MKMNKIDLNNLDKSTWSTFRFDQIASSISKRVDPNDTDLKHYIGLEHIDSENIHITRMGSPDDVNGQKLRCYPGDVIFGRRRAYQRKAAVCEVEGFCSAHSLVLRANPEVIDPKLFPFFLHSDIFMHRAVDISVGSLSPTINWSTLKKQEFLLPAKSQQAELARLFWSMDEVNEKTVAQIDKLENYKKAMMQELVSKGIGHTEFKDSPLGLIPKGWEITTFKSMISDMKSGLSRRIVSEDIGIPVLISGNIQKGKLDISELKYWYKDDPQGANVSNYILEDGDILLCFINSLSQIGKCCIFNDIGRDAIYTTNLFRIACSSEVSNLFFYYLLCSNYAQRKIEQITKPAVNQASFTKEDFLKIKVSLPPFEEQELIVERLSQIDSLREDFRLKRSASHSLQKSLISQVF